MDKDIVVNILHNAARYFAAVHIVGEILLIGQTDTAGKIKGIDKIRIN